MWNTIQETFRLQFEDKNIRWVEPDIDIVKIIGNIIDMLRIFRNLVQNALKYGGNSLSEVTMGYRRSEKHHILMVENKGERIPEKDEEIIFKELKRKPTTSKVYGSGLGLAIVMEIAKKHKGQSWLTKGSDGEPIFCVSIAQNLT